MTFPRFIIFAASALTAVSISSGQPPGESALSPLSFLPGRWVSETPTEVQEENWSPINGDSMIGSFRVIQHGKAVFYEFWAVELEGHRPVLKLKHFNANLAGWEDKDASTEMPLASSGVNDVVFVAKDGSVSLHYSREGSKLKCMVHHVSHGKSSDETFVLTSASV